MRPLLAALVVMVLLVGVTTDKVECLDGCTDELQPGGASAAAPSLCDLCHGWHAPHTTVIRGPSPPMRLALVALAPREEPAHAAPPDHPPRFADSQQLPITRPDA